VFAWKPVNEHVGLWGDNGRVDEAQEEESTDQRADGKVGGIWILALKRWRKRMSFNVLPVLNTFVANR
jgi:hypothetical protein